MYYGFWVPKKGLYEIELQVRGTCLCLGQGIKFVFFCLFWRAQHLSETHKHPSVCRAKTFPLANLHLNTLWSVIFLLHARVEALERKEKTGRFAYLVSASRALRLSFNSPLLSNLKQNLNNGNSNAFLPFLVDLRAYKLGGILITCYLLYFMLGYYSCEEALVTFKSRSCSMSMFRTL